jgi:hypothetical protein
MTFNDENSWVICEPWFIGSRNFCELWKYLSHK